MKRTLSLLLLIAGLNQISWSKQSDTLRIVDTTRNKISLSVGGYGLLYTINYERQLSKRTNFRPFFQFGFALYPPNLGPSERLWLSVSLNMDLRINNLIWLEFGAGQGFATWSPAQVTAIFVTGRAALRLQPQQMPCFLKAEFLPMILYKPESLINLWGAVTIGMRF